MNKSLGKKILAVLAAAAVPFATLLSSAPLSANAAESYISADTVKSTVVSKGKPGSTKLMGRSITKTDNTTLHYNYNGDIYTANSSMYDYLSDREMSNQNRQSKAEGYADPYVNINWAISNENYDIPLYLGCFYRGDNASNYTADNKGDGWYKGNSNKSNNDKYKNFYWQANMSLREGNFDASVQGLVDNTLTNGTITQSGHILPYFSDAWADEHPTMVKYWHDISFPFYGIDVDATKVHGDSNATGTAKYYQFNSRELNLYLETNDSTKTGRYKETTTQIYSQPTTTDADGTVCYLPFDSYNDYNKNNLAFGTYFDINFKIRSDGKVETVDSNGKGTGTFVHATFEFMGDDDVWVFIDGQLVLDLGGDHKDTTGLIDFADKKAYANDAVAFGSGGNDNISGSLGSRKTVELQNVMTPDTFDGNDYNEDKVHTLRMFYMERGMYESDLLVRFNFSAIPNRNTLKVREVTNFKGINAGLVELTKQAADYDVFNYTVSNTGTAKDDVGDSGILTPTYSYYQRHNEANADLTANLTGKTLVYDTVTSPDIFLDTSKNLSGGNTWDNNCLLGAWIWGDNNNGQLYFGEQTSSHLYKFSGFPSDSNKVVFFRLNKNVEYNLSSWPSFYNRGPEITLEPGHIYKVNDWDNSISKTSDVVTEQVIHYDEAQIFNPNNGTAVKNTHYIWTDEFAIKTPDSLPDGMTGITDGNGSFNLMYGTSEKESSAFFNAQFKKGSTMAVTQNSALKTVTRGDNAETFSTDKGRTVGKYYDTTVTIVDKDDIDVTNNGTTTETNYSYSNNDGKSPVQITQTFTNTPRVGALSVQKQLTHGDTVDDTFTFTVNFENIFGISEVQMTPDSYANVVVSIDGQEDNLDAFASFSLKGGQTATISGIPYGTKYTVTETDTSTNYQSSGANSFTGTIGEDESTSSYGGVVTNTRLTNSLTLSKALLGDYASEDENKVFTFRVKLDAPTGVNLSQYSISGADLGTYSNNSYTFDVAVSKNAPVTITGIPYGTTYTVYEPDDTEDWEKDTNTASGVINATPAAVSLTNTFAPPAKFGNLMISKNVLGANDSPDIPEDMKQQKFTFTVILQNAAGEPVNDTFVTELYVSSINQSSTLNFDETGKATFLLADDDYVKILNIPVDFTYTVEETVNAAYETTSEGATGTIIEDTLEAKFTNTKKFIPYTLPESGFDDTRMYFVFSLSGMMLCGLAYFFINRKKVNG